MADQEYHREGVFRFLDLPPELCNRIYGFGFAFAQNEPITLMSGKEFGATRTSWSGCIVAADGDRGKKSLGLAYGLLLASRQLYTEAKDLLYEDMIFVLFNLLALSEFVTRIGDRKERVTEVRVRYDPSATHPTFDAAAASLALLPKLGRLVLGMKPSLGTRPAEYKSRMEHQGCGLLLAKVVKTYLEHSSDFAERRKIFDDALEIREEGYLRKSMTLSRVQPWAPLAHEQWTRRLLAELLEKVGVLAAA